MIYRHILKGYSICLITFIIPVYLANYLLSLVNENISTGLAIYYLLKFSKYIFLCFYNVLSGILLIPYYSKLISLVEDHFNLQKLSVSMGFAVKNIFYSLYTFVILYSIYIVLVLLSFLSNSVLLHLLLFLYWQLYYGIACLSSIYPMSNAIDLLQTHPSFLILVAPLSYMTCTGTFEEALLYYQLLVIPILVIIRLIHGYMPVYRVDWLNWLKALVYMVIRQNQKTYKE
eukprot:NODE_291_length_11621_cov_0.390557.p7 type:complete len:230 gc:universal NODE_291_length_11621_cov_0.390557:6117-6806(+)